MFDVFLGVQEIQISDIYTGILVAKKHIREYGESDGECPYVIYLLAKGLFATNHYYEAHYWANRTVADPENLIPLQERIAKHCRL